MRKSGFVSSSLAAVLAFSAAAMPAAAETQAQAAQHLVSLVKPYERQAQAMRFMIAVAPLPLPEGLAGCMVAKGNPVFKEYFAKLYAAQLTDAELRQAVEFFQSEEGRSAVELTLRQEQKVFEAAAKGEQVSETPEYPPRVKKALDAFGATAVGKNFFGEEFSVRQPFSSEITDIRNGAMERCLAELAGVKPR